MKRKRIACEQLERRLQLNAPGANYKLSFDDEFNGTSLDTTKWNLYLPWSNSVSGDNRYHDTNGNYLSYMMPDDVSFPGDGTVHLTTEKRNETAPSGHVFNYTEGMITSSQHLTYAYGYAEIRAKLPTGLGNWDAFWMTNGWPPEDDVMEYWPGASASTPRSHQGLYGMDQAWHDYNATTTSTVPSTSTDPAKDWHTFGFEWGPGYQKMYIDGTLKLSISGSYIPSTANPEYMLLNSGVQNGQTANYDTGTGTTDIQANTLQVDYVRVYSYTVTAGPTIVNAGFDTTGGWTNTGAAAYNPGTSLGQTGTGDLHIYGVGESDQTITGLLPNTTYTVSGSAEIGSGTAAGLIGAKNFLGGGGNVSSPIGNTAQTTPVWAMGSQSFRTGPTDTSATIYLMNTVGNNMNYDDLSLYLTPAATVTSLAAAPNTTASIPLAQGTFGSNWTLTSLTSSDQSVVANSGLSLNSGKTAVQAVMGSAQSGSTTITMTLTNSGVTSPIVTTFVLNVLPALAVSGDANGGTIRVVRNATDSSLVDLYVNNTSTTPTSEYNYANYSAMNISGLNSNDSLVIDYTNGDPVTAGGITFNGGSGTDNVSFVGLPSGNTVRLGSSSVQIFTSASQDIINFSSAETLNLDQGGGSNTLFSPSSTTNFTAVNLTVDGGSTLTLGPDTALPTNTTLSLATGATFNLLNQSESIDQLTGTGTLNTGNGSPAAGTLTIGVRGGSSTFNGSITGSSGLTKVGAGTFTLGGTNTFTGNINIGNSATTGGNVNGILKITKSTAVNTSKLISLNDNNSAWGLFQLDGSNGSISLPSTLLFNLSANTNANNVIENIGGNNSIAGAITFNVGGTGYGILSDSGSLSFTGAQAITHTLNLRGAGNGGFSGSLSSSGSLNQSGTGVWTLSASNSYTGSTTVSSGQLTLANGNALGATSGVSVSSGATLGLQGSITIPSGKTFTINGTGVGGAGALLNVSGNNIWTSALTLSGTGGTIGSNVGQLTLSAGLSGGALSKVGNGSVILNGANTYTTTTNVSGGTLELLTGSLAAATTNVSGGATLIIDSATTIPVNTALSDAGTVNLKNANQTIATLNGAGVLNLNPTALNVTGGGTFSGSIAGTGGVTVSGGTLNLTGSNSFSGGTSVTAGQLNVGNSDALASGGLTISGTALTALAVGLSKGIKLSSLSIVGNAVLDVANDAMVIEGTESTIEGWVQSGLAGGLGIRSSSIVPGSANAIGVAAATDLTASFPYTFVNQQADAGSVLLRYTLMGDGDLSGAIDIGDFNILAANYGSSGMRWATGDFNFDGVVNLLDLNSIATNFGVPLAGAIPAVVPLSAPVAAMVMGSLFGDQAIRDSSLVEDVL